MPPLIPSNKATPSSDSRSWMRLESADGAIFKRSAARGKLPSSVATTTYFK